MKHEQLRPKVAILKTGGINCDQELMHAFNTAGGESTLVHVNDLKYGKDTLRNYRIFAIPGGFSYGDDIASGRVLANELITAVGDQVNDFIHRDDGLVLGVCNGFQVLVRAGILPYREPVKTLSDMDVTLSNNTVGHFECRPVDLLVEKASRCVFTQDMDETVTYYVAHGEGKFVADEQTINHIENEGLIVFRYVDASGSPTQEFPMNPNDSMHAIAGITDPSGRVLGMMPHPERSIEKYQDPNWRRKTEPNLQGRQLFDGMVRYAKEM